ncbi:hypothetical protein BJ742DRAFT_865521 [Cladochytrium replicatum]|nr:hypothetical protein BJ742DRAFT_865521 [Cladochytrium replicatum]
MSTASPHLETYYAKNYGEVYRSPESPRMYCYEGKPNNVTIPKVMAKSIDRRGPLAHTAVNLTPGVRFTAAEKSERQRHRIQGQTSQNHIQHHIGENIRNPRFTFEHVSSLKVREASEYPSSYETIAVSSNYSYENHERYGTQGEHLLSTALADYREVNSNWKWPFKEPEERSFHQRATFSNDGSDEANHHTSVIGHDEQLTGVHYDSGVVLNGTDSSCEKSIDNDDRNRRNARHRKRNMVDITAYILGTDESHEESDQTEPYYLPQERRDSRRSSKANREAFHVGATSREVHGTGSRSEQSFFRRLSGRPEISSESDYRSMVTAREDVY